MPDLFGIDESILGDWEDPYPQPEIHKHDGFYVVRDDLLVAGSKCRFIDYMIGNSKIKEWVYGSSPATGYAQMSLAHVCTRYKKKAVVFMAKRDPKNMHEYQTRAIEYGAEMHWVPNGMLSVTEKRARDYVAEDPETRSLLPIGFDHPTVLASIKKVAESMDEPEEVWTVGSSGTLTRGLQSAWKSAKFNVVMVGHKGDYGRAKVYKSSYEFSKPTKVLPPYPSAPTYDAKVWEFVKEHASPGALIWNVGK
jgi:hypothetical protein